MLILHSDIKDCFSNPSTYFDDIMLLQGEVYRQLEGRCTKKITLNNKNYFIKQHVGVGWKEIFKNLFQLRWPVTSARHEWRAISLLKRLNIATPEIVGFGCRGWNPARFQSFLITKELPENTSLESLCKNWAECPPPFSLKKRLIQEVARITRTLHRYGINHRDLYICHLLAPLSSSPLQPSLYLIDLHRAQIRSRVPKRWVIKDLAGLYFSSKDIGLKRKDILRFMKNYHNKSIKTILREEKSFWAKVKKRGDKLYEAEKQG